MLVSGIERVSWEGYAGLTERDWKKGTGLEDFLTGSNEFVSTGTAGSKYRVACFAGLPAPTGTTQAAGSHCTCGSGHAREESSAVDGTGFAGVRGHARSHSDQ